MSKDFKPQDYFRYKKLREKWRKPKGLQSKMRLGIKGAGKKVKIGYRTAKQLRYLVGGVIKAKIVKSPKDLGDNDSIIIASSLGKKKVLEIYKEAEKRKIMILNKKSVKSAKEREEKIKQVKELRKKAKKEQKKEKAESKEQSKEMEKKNK